MRCKKTDNIKQLKLSSKTLLELKRNGIEKIEDLLCYQEKDFSQFRHIQHGRLDEIKDAVHAVGFLVPDEDLSGHRGAASAGRSGASGRTPSARPDCRLQPSRFSASFSCLSLRRLGLFRHRLLHAVLMPRSGFGLRVRLGLCLLLRLTCHHSLKP